MDVTSPGPTAEGPAAAGGSSPSGPVPEAAPASGVPPWLAASALASPGANALAPKDNASLIRRRNKSAFMESSLVSGPSSIPAVTSPQGAPVLLAARERAARAVG